MEKRFGDATIRLQQGDITHIHADVLVTAANEGLRGGGGVDGAIHRAAGPKLLDACRQVGGCPSGSAVRTDAFNLRERGVKHIIHAVGPRWQGGERGEAELLRGAYEKSLEIAERLGCRSVAFPSISTGVYGYPVAEAAALALRTVAGFLEHKAGSIETVIFALFDAATLEAYEAALAQLGQASAQ